MSSPISKIKLKLAVQSPSNTSILGPVLGQKKINMQEFNKKFNALTEKFINKVPLNVEILVYKNNQFNVNIKLPSVTFFIIEIIKHERFINKKNKNISIPIKWIYEISKLKIDNNKHNDNELKRLCKTTIGTLKSLGVKIKK